MHKDVIDPAGTVVAGMDGRAEGLDAVALADRFAALAGARLVVVAAYPYAPLSSRVLDAPTDAATAREALESARRALGARDAQLMTVAGSSPGRTLHEVAEELGAGLIVVGSSHRGPAGRLVLGGVTAETLRRAPCAVAVAPRGWAGGARSLARIGVAVDGSARDRSALSAATRIAERVEPRAFVQTIHAEPVPRRIPDAPSVDAQLQLQGDPADALASHSAKLNLLVLGSRGRGRVGAVVLGSVAARLAGMARCPVLALPAGAAVDPLVGVASTVAADL